MEELVKISLNDEKEQVVEGRELHKFLELTERYSSWFKRMLQYGFVENVDFTSVKSFTVVNNGAKKEIDNHLLKISMAKELSMLQRNDKGKQARLYFIKCEEEYKKQKQNMLPQDYIQALEKLLESEKEKERLKVENERNKKELEEKDKIIEEQAPKVSYYDLILSSKNLLTVTQIAKDYGFKSATELNKVLNNLKIQYKLNNTWSLYAKYSGLGYTRLISGVTEKGYEFSVTKWTQKGRLFLYEILKSNGILPLIEREDN